MRSIDWFLSYVEFHLNNGQDEIDLFELQKIYSNLYRNDKSPILNIKFQNPTFKGIRKGVWSVHENIKFKIIVLEDKKFNSEADNLVDLVSTIRSKLKLDLDLTGIYIHEFKCPVIEERFNESFIDKLIKYLEYLNLIYVESEYRLQEKEVLKKVYPNDFRVNVHPLKIVEISFTDDDQYVNLFRALMTNFIGNLITKRIQIYEFEVAVSTEQKQHNFTYDTYMKGQCIVDITLYKKSIDGLILAYTTTSCFRGSQGFSPNYRVELEVSKVIDLVDRYNEDRIK